jgi:SAM-dependent methyltransferase
MTTPPAPAGPVTPDRVFQLSWGFALTRTLTTAVELELFRHVAEGKRTADAIAKAVGASPRAVGMVVNALVGLGLLARTGGPETPVSLAADAETFLVKGSPAYIGDFVLLHSRLIDAHWAHLTDVVKSGKPYVAVDKPAEGMAVWHQLVDTLFALGFRAAQQVGDELARLYPGKPVRLLDVAAGSGVWGIGASTTNPGVRPTFQDLEDTLTHTKRWVGRMKVGDRAAYLPGDLRRVDFGTAAFDAAVLGHICHSEGAEHTKALFRKVAKALAPGGTLFVVDFVPDADRRGPPMALLFALNMVVNTTDGDTFTMPEYAAWLTEAGFRDVRAMPAAAPSPLVVATKA